MTLSLVKITIINYEKNINITYSITNTYFL